MSAITVDEAIEQLQAVKAKSVLGGNTCLHVCIQNVEYQPVTEIILEQITEDSGAVALVMQPFKA